MKFASARDLIWARRCAKGLLGAILLSLWSVGFFLLYQTSPFSPRLVFSDSWCMFAQRGKTLVTAARPNNGEIRLWKTATGEQLRTITPNRPGRLLRLAIHAEGNFVEAVYDTMERIIYDAETGEPVLKENVHSFRDLSEFVLSPDGKHYAVLEFDKKRTSYLAKIPTQVGEDCHRISLPDVLLLGNSWGVAEFSPDGSLLFVAKLQWEKPHIELKIVDRTTGKRLRNVSLESSRSFACSADGKMMAVVRANELAQTTDILLFHPTEGTELGTLPLPAHWHVGHLAFLPGNKLLVITGPEAGISNVAVSCREFDLVAKQERVILDLPWRGEFMATSDDHTKLIVGHMEPTDDVWRRLLGRIGVTTRAKESLQVTCLDLTGELPNVDLPPEIFKISPDGLAALSYDRGITKIWDIPPRQNGWRIAALVGMILLPFALLVLRRRRLARSALPRATGSN